MTTCKNLVSKFSKPAYETLVDWINVKNNRSLSLEQFKFGKVTAIGDQGDCEIEFNFVASTGWPTTKQTLTVQRVNLTNIPGLNVLTIHASDYSQENILNEIHNQYGLYLDKDLVSFDLNGAKLNEVFPNTLLNGFSSTDDIVETLEPKYGTLGYLITINDNHPTLIGHIPVYVRQSIESFQGNIDSVLKLREFYLDGKLDIPFVETIQPQGIWVLSNGTYGSPLERKRAASILHSNIREGDVILSEMEDDILIGELLNVLGQITECTWKSTVEDNSFNLYGATVLYNGISDPVVNTAPIEYNHTLVIKLSDSCTNLQGVVRIAYKYASTHHPMNKNRAGIIVQGY